MAGARAITLQTPNVASAPSMPSPALPWFSTTPTSPFDTLSPALQGALNQAVTTGQIPNLGPAPTNAAASTGAQGFIDWVEKNRLPSSSAWTSDQSASAPASPVLVMPDGSIRPLMQFAPPTVAPAPASYGAPLASAALGLKGPSSDDVFTLIGAALAAAECPPLAIFGITAAYVSGKLAYANRPKSLSPLAMPTLCNFDESAMRPISYEWPDGTIHPTPPTWPGWHGQIISRPTGP